MKKLMMTAALLAAITVSAQRGGGRGFEKDLSAEELATLKTKKMTLALALDEKQYDEVYVLVLDQVKDRKAIAATRKAQDEKPELTKEQKLEKMNERLDKRIAIQNEMKAILTDSQFEQFKQLNDKRNRKRGDNNKDDRRSRK